tara:strand:+ start:421 stop:930 length:510 start_codon:yes stop_codon:yes gene_type:complete
MNFFDILKKSAKKLSQSEYFNFLKNIFSQKGTNAFSPGKLYAFSYNDPKTRDRLDHWDTTPIILFLGPAKNGFYGLNFHYLSPGERAAFLNELQDNESQNVKINVNAIQNLTKSPMFKRSIKHYIGFRAKGIREIPPGKDFENWINILRMSTGNFTSDRRRLGSNWTPY